ncbi:hypothetical protein JCM6882_003205 [Rhodosporidiobolus microsporus]
MWPAAQPWGGPAAGPSSWPSPAATHARGPYPSSAPHAHAPPVYQPYPHAPPSHSRPAQSTSVEPVAASRTLSRQRSASNDVGFHPYKQAVKPAPSSSSPPTTSLAKPILFVDTTQQASGHGDAMHQCRPKRKRITPEQLVRLTGVFEKTDSPSYDVRDKIGAEIGMTNREVQVWFQNRRAKVNRQRQAALAKEQSEQAVAMMSQAAAVAAQPKAPVETLSAGQHQWRFRPGARGQYVPPQMQQPPHAPPPAPVGPPSPRRAPAAIAVPPPHPQAYRQPFPSQPHPSSYYPTSTSLPHQSQFGPAYSPNLSPSLGYGPSGPSYFPMASPALSNAAPSLASPGSVASSYFSRNEPPFTPSTTISSPSNTLFRLTLESPRVGPLSPPSAPGHYEPISPQPDELEAPIHLAPIRNMHYRIRPSSSKSASRPMHRRSISDSAAHASFLPPPPPPPRARPAPPAPSAAAPTSSKPVRLPSLRGLLNDDEPQTSPPLGTASAPTSPVELLNPLPPTPDLPSGATTPRTMPLTSRPFPRPLSRSASPAGLQPRPRLVSRYSTMDIHRSAPVERRTPPVAVNVHPGRDVDGAAAPLGLGMLCAAATELSAGDEKAQRLAESQRMR